MSGWKVKLLSALLLALLLFSTPSPLLYDAALTTATLAEPQGGAVCVGGVCMWQGEQMPGAAAGSIFERSASFKLIHFSFSGGDYDRYGRFIYTYLNVLSAPGVNIQLPFLTCANIVRSQIGPSGAVKLLGVIDPPGSATTYVGVGGHGVGSGFRGFVIVAHPSTSGRWSEGQVTIVKVPAQTDGSIYSYHVEDDDSGTFFWLSSLGIWAVRVDGSVAWKREEAEFRQGGVLVYGGGRLLYYGGDRIFILSAGDGSVLESYSVKARAARYDAEQGAFIVVATNGTVYRVASQPVEVARYSSRLTDFAVALDRWVRAEDGALYVGEARAGARGVSTLEVVPIQALGLALVPSTGPWGTYATAVTGNAIATVQLSSGGWAMVATWRSGEVVKVAAWSGWGFEEFAIDARAMISLDDKPLVAAFGAAELDVVVAPNATPAAFTLDRDGLAPGVVATDVELYLRSFTPLGSTVALAQGIGDVAPAYYDFESASALVNWMKVATVSSFWNTSLRDGLSVKVRLDGVWHSTAYSVADSVPVASLGLFWLHQKPIRTADFDEIAVTATVEMPGMDTRMETALLLSDLTLFLSSTVGFYVSIVKPGVFTKALRVGGTEVDVPVDLTSQAVRSVGVTQRLMVKVGGFSDALKALIRQGVSGDVASAALTRTAREAAHQAAAGRVAAAATLDADMYTAFTVADETVKALQRISESSVFTQAEREAARLALQLLSDAAGSSKTPKDVLAEIILDAMKAEAVNGKLTAAHAAEVSASAVEGAINTAVQHYGKRIDNLVDVLNRIRSYVVTAVNALLLDKRLPPFVELTLGSVPAVQLSAAQLAALAEASGSGERVDASAFASFLAVELVKAGLPQDRAERAAQEAASYVTVTYLIVAPYELKFDYSSGALQAVAEAATGFASSLLLSKAAKVSAVTVGSVAGASLLAASGAAAFLLASQLVYAITAVVADFQVGMSQQGAYAVGGLAVETSAPDGSARKLWLFGVIPDEVISLVRSTGAGSYGKLSDWVLPVLEKWAKEAGYDFLEVEPAPPANLKELGPVIRRVGVFFMPIVWNRLPPPLSFQSYTATWTGGFTLKNFAIYAKRSGSMGERGFTGSESDFELARSLVVETEYGKVKPTNVSFSQGTMVVKFLLPKPATRIKVYSEDASALASGKAVLKLFAADRLRPLHENGSLAVLSGLLANEGDILFTVDEIIFGNLPANATPVGFEFGLPGAAAPLFIPENKAEKMVNPLGLLRYRLDTSFLKLLGLSELQPGSKIVANVVYRAASPPVPPPKPVEVYDRNGTSVPQPPPEPGAVYSGAGVVVRLNGTLRWATLPSMASVYVTSTFTQRVNLTVGYKFEVEHGDRWVSVESGVMVEREQLRVRANETVRRNYDIEGLVTKLVQLVRERNETAKLFVYAAIEPEKDANPIDNYAYDTVTLTPKAVEVLLGSGNFKLTVWTVDAVTGAPVSAQISVDGRTATAANGTASFTLPAGVYNVTATASGYMSASRTVVVNSDVNLLLPMVPLQAQLLPPSGNATQPPISYNDTVYVPLQVKVATQDGYPVRGAEVYVNGTLVGVTDAWGTWMRYYPYGTRVAVKVSVPERGWTSEERSAVLESGLAVVFLAPWRSNYTLPEVAVVDVRVASFGNTTQFTGERLTLSVTLVTSVPQRLTLRVGFLRDGADAGSEVYNVTLRDVGLFTLLLPVTVKASGRVRPYAEIIYAENDTVKENNRLVGGEILVWKPLLVYTYLVYDFVSQLPAGMLYPEKSYVKVFLAVKATRSVKFKEEFGEEPRILVVTAGKHVGPASVQGSFSVKLSEAGLNTTYVHAFNVTTPWARFIQVNVTGLFPLPIFTRNASYVFEIPPHFVVKGGSAKQAAVRPGDKVGLEVVAWSNKLPGEEWSLYFILDIAGKVVTTMKAVEVQPGTARYETYTLLPSVEMSVWEPMKAVNVTLTASAAPDAYAGDNMVYAQFYVLNTTSWLFWLLVLTAIILVLIFLKVLVSFNPIRHAIEEERAKRRKFVKLKHTISERAPRFVGRRHRAFVKRSGEAGAEEE